MGNIPRMDQDDREIEALWYGEASFQVGKRGVTRIAHYKEAGEMAMVSWFAVYRGEHLWARTPARAVDTVIYAQPDEGGEDHGE